MQKFKQIGSLAVGFALLAATPSFAMPNMSKGHMMMNKGHMMGHAMSGGYNMNSSRFSGPGQYTGAPKLPLTLSMVVAGGGPKNFQTVTLVKVLAGDKTKAEVAKLTKQYGKKNVGTFLTVFKFVVDDSLKIVTAKKVALPKTPSPDPTDGKALAAALWNAGVTPKNEFNVEVMLDKLASHPIHSQVMRDIDAKYGIAADATYHAALNQAMHDLASVYGLRNGMAKM